MTDRRQIADELWAAFKHWDGERKFALRLIVKHIKNTPGGVAEGQSLRHQADGLNDSAGANVVQTSNAGPQNTF